MAGLDPTNLLQPVQDQSQVAGLYPADYTTPDARKAMYDYSQALLKNSMGAVPGTKGGWTVGLQHIVDALVGGQQAYAANKADLSAAAFRAGQRPQTPGTMATPAPVPGATPYAPDNSDSAPSATPSEGAGNSSQGGSDIIGKMESGGKYDNVTTTTNPKSGQKQSAIGKYGVMDFNVGPWTKQILGKEMTPEEFLQNTKAQDAVARTKLAEYTAKYGPEGAGRAWLGGEGGINHPNRTDAFGTSVGDYGSRYAKALAFNGKPAGPVDDASNVIALALSKGAAPAAVPGTPSGQDGQQYVAPYAVPQRPQYTRQQFERLVEDPNLSEAQKTRVLDEYMSQRAPVGVDYLGGKVIVNPSNPKEQFYSPGVKSGDIKAGAASAPSDRIIVPGKNGAPPTIQYIEEGKTGASAAPATTTAPPPPLAPNAPIALPPATAPSPVVPPAGAPAAPPVPVTPPAPIIQPPRAEIPPAGPETPPGMPTNGLVGQASAANQVASNVPMATAGAPVVPGPAETGNAAIAKAQGALPPAAMPGAEGAPPAALSPMGAKVASALATQPPPAEAGVQTAELPSKLKELQEFDLNQKRREADITDLHKNLQTYTDVGIRAQKELQSLPIAMKMLDDPRYRSGFGADFWEGLGKVRSMLGDKGAAAPMEIFNKILSGNIVQDLKVQLGGLGQIRLAEINLITNSVANKYNTPEANKAVLGMQLRQSQQAANIGRVADAYAKGWEPDPKGGWVRSNEPPTSWGLQGVIDKYTLQNPLFSQAEIDNIQHIFDISPKTANSKVPAAQTKADLAAAAHLTPESGTATPAATPTSGAAPAAAPAKQNDPLGIR